MMYYIKCLVEIIGITLMVIGTLVWGVGPIVIAILDHNPMWLVTYIFSWIPGIMLQSFGLVLTEIVP